MIDLRKVFRLNSLIFTILVVFLVSSACSNPSGSKPETYSLGDTGPGGGIIFYVHPDPDGFPVQGYSGSAGSFDGYTAYYLEAAPSDFSAKWGDSGTEITNGVSTSKVKPPSFASTIGNGRKDTKLIVQHMTGEGISDTAAQSANALQTGDKDDWFLPSLGELDLLYQNRAYVENLDMSTTIFYWSSVQCDMHIAWVQQFFNGNQEFATKNGTGTFRAIRAF